jgi:hypothetical protein
MSFLDDIVTLSITRSTRTPTRAGFGVALLLAYHTLNADRVREYSSLDGMVDDGFTPYDPAYLAAQSYFAQSPAPTRIKVGRRALAPTQVVELTPSSPSASEVSTVKIDGLTATFTADGTPTVAEACTGIAAAINALADVDAIVATGASSASEQELSGSQLDGVTGYASMSIPRKITFTFSSHANWDATTATLAGIDGNGLAQSESIAIPDGGNTTVTSTKKYLQVTSITIPAQSGTSGTFTVGVAKPVTADGTSTTKVVCTASSGELHSFELVTPNLSLHDATTNPGVATDLAAIVAADNDWYGLLLDSNSPAEVTAAAAWTETHKKLFGYQTSETAHLSAGSTSVLAYTLRAAGYARTEGIFAKKLGTSDAWLAAGWMGARFAKDPGAATWKFASLAGSSVYDLTDSQRAALDGYRLNYYTTAGGVGITAEGVTASGEFIDVTRDLDWLSARIQEGVFGALISNDKIPFTDAGISAVLSSVRAALNGAVRVGVLASFTLSAPRAADVSSGNKAIRHLPDVTFQATLAGAIHSLTITGRVSV